MVRYRRWLVVWSSLWLMLGLLVVPSAAWGEADADRGVKDPVGEAATVVAPVRCSLVPTDSPNHEFASCLRVDATLDRALSVGETGTLTVGVFSQVTGAGTVTVDVPAGLEVSSGPGISGSLVRARSGFGEMAPRVIDTEFVADETVSFTLGVRATAAGPAPIEVRAMVDVGSYTDSAMDTAYLTISDGSRAASLTVDVPTVAGVTAVFDAPVGPVPVDEFEAAPPVVVDPVNDDGIGSDPSAPESCVTGRWGYQHPTNGYTGVPNATVQAWDYDTFSGDDLLDSGVTNWDGTYSLCWTETDGEGSGAQEVYVKFRSSNTLWRVNDASQNVYENTTPQVSLAPGADHSFGSLEPANNIHRGLHAFHAVDKLWQWGIDPGPGLCFDWDETSCRQLKVRWYVGSTDGTYYSLAGNEVRLAEADPDAEYVVIHEATHAVMDDVYNDDYPPFPNCNPHYIDGASSLGCAWQEGFAEWVPASVLNSPTWGGINFETTTWTTPGWWDDGPTVEGRVASAMIDISDSGVAPEDYWDEWSESEMVQWELFQDWNLYGDNMPPDTYEEFWTDRGQAFLNLSDANGCNYQNTIDFSFREDLYAYAQKTRPAPLEDDHRYRVWNNSAVNQDYWSVVAIRPDSDVDLQYFEDFNQTTILASSTWGGTTLDLIAIDNGHRPFGEFGQWDYPKVVQFAGTGDYQIEWAAAQQGLSNGLTTRAFGPADVVHVRDSWHSAGELVYYRVVPGAGQDVEAFLFDSDPSSSATWVQGRGSAVTWADWFGADQAESFSASTSTADWLGFAVTNKNGVGGTVSMYRDTSAPVGSVTIANGAGVTSSPSVPLSLSALDAETGILDMRVSTDGVFDTESWESFSSSKAVTLPGSFGTKTVKVEFRNNAGMVTSTSDSIMYTDGPATDSEWLVIDGSDHVAVLFTDPGTGATWVDVRRVSNGALVSSIDFGSSYPGSDLEILDRGSGAPELVVLGTDVRGAVRATARDAMNGSLVARANYGSTYGGDDLETVGLNKLAVMGTNPGNDIVRVQTRNLSDLLVGNAFLGNAFTGDDLEMFGSNVAVLGTKYANDNVRVRVVDPAAGTTLGNSYFGTAFVGVDLEVMGSNLAVLQQRLSDGNVRTQVRTLAGTKVATVGFGTAYTGDVLRVVGSDVAVGGTKPSNGAVRVQTRTLAGSVVGTAQFGTGYSCLEFETVGGDVAVFGLKANGKIRDQIRTTTGTVIATLYYN